MKHRVLLLSRAQTQIAVILRWLVKHSADGANRWLDELDATLLMLEDDPERHPLAAESDGVRYEIREVSFHTPSSRRYRLLFTVVADEVRVLGIRGPGQDFAATDDLG